MLKVSTLNDNRKYTVTCRGRKGVGGESDVDKCILAFEPLSILNCMQNCNDDYLIILDHILQSYMISKVLSNTTL